MKRVIDESDALVIYEDGEPLRVGEKEHDRDRHRWELDPVSAEDYIERWRATFGESQRVRHMGHVDRFARRDPR